MLREVDSLRNTARAAGRLAATAEFHLGGVPGPEGCNGSSSSLHFSISLLLTHTKRPGRDFVSSGLPPSQSIAACSRVICGSDFGVAALPRDVLALPYHLKSLPDHSAVTPFNPAKP